MRNPGSVAASTSLVVVAWVSAPSLVAAQTFPTAPTSISTVPYSATQINLTWSASIDDVGVAGYEIERCQGATCTNFALVAGSSTLSYQDSGLATSTTYRYRLRAVDWGGNFSSYSSAITTATGLPSPIRINAGGSAYTDSASNVWSADTGYTNGSSATTGATITGTPEQSLYQSIRWHVPDLDYAIAVPPGPYEVRLHFAESWGAYSVGARVFHVQLEGVTALSSIDLFAAAGANAAHIETATTNVSDGSLNIHFAQVTGAPFVSAIEVLWVAPADNTAPSAPSGLSAVPISGGAINLTWSAASDNVAVAGYAIERCTGVSCIDFTEFATTSTTSRLDTGLSPNITYRYRVRAFDAGGNRSAYSSIDEAETPNASAEYVYDELGRLALVTVASGASIVYAYDESGNVTAIVRAAP